MGIHIANGLQIHSGNKRIHLRSWSWYHHPLGLFEACFCSFGQFLLFGSSLNEGQFFRIILLISHNTGNFGLVFVDNVQQFSLILRVVIISE